MANTKNEEPSNENDGKEQNGADNPDLAAGKEPDGKEGDGADNPDLAAGKEPDAKEGDGDEPEEEFEEVSEVEQVIVDVETVKEKVVKVLGGDAEKFFIPIEAALEFKKNQDGFSEENAEEAARKQLENREAEILALQEAAAKKLDELYGK